jgi:hypothetical protein
MRLFIQLVAKVLVRGASDLNSRSADNIFCGFVSIAQLELSAKDVSVPGGGPPDFRG